MAGGNPVEKFQQNLADPFNSQGGGGFLGNALDPLDLRNAGHKDSGDPEADRQARIEAAKAASRAALNEKFGEGDSEAAKANKAGRDAIYSDVRTNAYTAGKRGLDETREKAQRQNGFSLFAQGLNGGSEDIDQNVLLDRTYNQGVLDIGAKADSAKASLQGNDEQTRLGLLQSIDNGMDQGSAISSAINSMKNAGDKAAADAQGTTLGDLFATSGALYTKSQAAQGKAAGQDWWNSYNSGAGGSKSSNSSRTGTTSATY